MCNFLIGIVNLMGWKYRTKIIGIEIALINNIYPIPYTAYGDPLAGIIVSFFVLKSAN